MQRPQPLLTGLLWLLSLALILSGIVVTYAALRPAAGQQSIWGRSTGPAGSSAASAQDDGPPGISTLSPAEALRLAVPGPLPGDLGTSLEAWLGPAAQVITDTQQADLWLTGEDNGALLAERYYVAVSRVATLDNQVAAPKLLALWLGGPADGEQPLVVDQDTAAALRILWGEPVQVEVVDTPELVAQLLEETPGRLGIVPFDGLVPRLHPLAIDGNSPLHKTFDAKAYPLALRLYLGSRSGQTALADSLRAHMAQSGLHTNRDPAKMTVLAMTGVTAMARLTAQRMEQMGHEYPAQVIGPDLAAADLTHISNEVPFVSDCQVDTSLNNIVLCSRPEYLAALRAVGVDLVGLTGNHLNDFGRQASLDSLAFYEAQDLPTYGGGADKAQAQEPFLVEHNGNRLAFLGANYFGPPAALATEDGPGAAPYDLEALSAAIASARTQQDADLVLVELQWEESYDTMPIASQSAAFPQISAAGADIVTGVQSHVPQAVAFHDGKLILYGLGNLFFDQMWSPETRQGLIARHLIYDGRHLSTELLVTILEDYSQPRWATEAERAEVLSRVFTASGW